VIVVNDTFNQTGEISIQMKADLIRSDLNVGLIWFLNYAALDPSAVKSSHLDLHGTGMLPEDVEKFAHRWLSASRSIDIDHDGVGRPIHVVESFFNSADVNASAWPVNSHAVRLDVSRSEEAVKGLREGTLNSVSLDALTFNKVRRLPVSQQRSSPLAEVPSDVETWAIELARLGFEGITTIHRQGSDLYICQRSHGLPIAVHIGDEFVDVTPSGGAWGHLAMAMCESGTLTKLPASTSKDGKVIDHSSKVAFTVDYAPSPYKIDTVDALNEAFYTIEESPFVALVPDGGLLPHHVLRGGKEMVNIDAVRKALQNIDLIPTHLREDARKHLIQHLREAT